MLYTMRVNGRFITDVNAKTSLTHEQLFVIIKEAKNRKLTLAQREASKCVNTDSNEIEEEEEEEEG